MPFLVQISPTGKPIFIGGAAEDINEQPDPELLGEKIVDRTINSRQIASIAGYATGTGTMRAGSLVLEAILLSVQQYREELQAVEPKAQIYDVDQMDENLSVLFPGDERVGNIINEFKVDGVNSYQLLYDGTGWFAGGKISWTYVGDEAQLVVDGEIIARTGILENLSVEGTLTMANAGVIRDSSFSYTLAENGLSFFVEDDISINPDGAKAIKFIGTVGDFPTLMTVAYVGATNEVPNSARLLMYGDTGFRIGVFQNTDAIAYDKSSTSSLDRILVNLKTRITNTTNSTSSTTGALQVAGGIGVGGNSWFGGTSTFTGTTIVPNATADNHALNRITGDNRYWTREDLRIEDAGAGTITANRTITFEVEGATYAVNALEI